MNLRVEDMHPRIRVARRRIGPFWNHQVMNPDHVLYFFLAGTGQITINSRRYDFAPGHLIHIPSFLRFSQATDAAPAPECDLLLVHFDFEARRFRPLPAPRPPHEVRFKQGMHMPEHRVFPRGSRIERIFLDMVESWSGDETLGPLRAQALLTVILLDLVASEHPQTSKPVRPAAVHRIQQTLDYIDHHLHEPIELATLTTQAGLSSGHLIDCFRRMTGYSPMRYLRQVRIDRAAAMLTDPTLAIKQVAARCGFDDPYHFSKVFRQVKDVSPSRYRQLHTAANSPPSTPNKNLAGSSTSLQTGRGR